MLGMASNVGNCERSYIGYGRSGNVTTTEAQHSLSNDTTASQAFKSLIYAPKTDLRELRRISRNGIPRQFRAIVWKIILGYLPRNSTQRDSAIKRKRNDYQTLLRFNSISNFSTMSKNDRAKLRDIRVGFSNCAPSATIFKFVRVRRCIERLLFVWSKNNPGMPFTKGLSDMVTPLFVVFLGELFDGSDMTNSEAIDEVSDEILKQVEADCYWCFSNLMLRVEDHYTPDQPQVRSMVLQLEALMRQVDCDFYSYLMRNSAEVMGVEVKNFSFQWMDGKLIRELPLHCVVRMWDTYLSEDKDGFDGFHVHVCGALLLHFRPYLKSMAFDGICNFLQCIPATEFRETDIETVLSQAHFLKRRTKTSPPVSTRSQVPKPNCFMNIPRTLNWTASLMKSLVPSVFMNDAGDHPELLVGQLLW